MDGMNQVAVTRNYSLTIEHIGKVVDMAARTGKSQGEIVRNAIDLLYASLQPQPTQPTQDVSDVRA